MNVTDVIRSFGGYQQAMKLWAISRSQLAGWELTGIPAKRWSQIALLSQNYAEKPLTLDELATVVPSRGPGADECHGEEVAA